MKPYHALNNQNNFISGWFLEDLEFCDEVIEFHKIAPGKHPGKFGKGKEIGLIDKTVKDSIDCSLTDNEELYTKYIRYLREIMSLYCEQYPFAGNYGYFVNDSDVNIQYYPPGGGYHTWHTERTSNAEPVCNRHLVFMTYLNDVTDAGETEFYHQKIKVGPKKGLTLVWPADWTFTHKGIMSPTQEKYIITGWMNFTDDEDLIRRGKL
jgi:hypothetical protein